MLGVMGIGQPGGSLVAPSFAADTPQGAWTRLCGMQYRAPDGAPLAVPVVLALDVAAQYAQNPDIPAFQSNAYLAHPFVSPEILALMAGTTGFVEALMQGAVRVIYGANGVLQTRIIDPKSGSYQLPPCDTVTVDAAAYNRSGDGASTAYTLQASLAPGTVPVPQEPTVSGVRTAAAGNETLSAPYFQGVNRVRVGATAVSGIGSDVQLTVVGTQPQVEIDYSVPSWVNQVPDLVPVFLPSEASLSVDKAGTDTAQLFMQQVIGW